MPDSITTWAFTAVGVGQHGGVCMSTPLHMEVFKPFFAQVRLPYKAVRLEEVVVHIGIYNYKTFAINVSVLRVCHGRLTHPYTIPININMFRLSSPTLAFPVDTHRFVLGSHRSQ